ncbi:hypothetical protein [Nostoc sp.]|uniref:hypothetical protein n=1 Tax=Nostoc sp. TaxID=1180 RepID=UPI002FF535F1
MQLSIIALFSVTVIVCISYLGLYRLSWQRAIKLVLIIVIFEGVLRKWVLPQASDQIYFLKDLFLLLAYLKYYFSSESKYRFKFSFFNIILILTIAWCVFQAFNPSLGSPIIGLFGLKAYFFYMPLMWILPSLFKTEEELYLFLRNFMLLAIPVCLLAVVQYFSPSLSPINVWAGGQEANATAGGAIRVTGTFPYITGYSSYLMICVCILVPMLSLQQSQLWKWLTYVETLLVIGTSFMTGARSLLTFEILFLIGYASILTLTKPSIATRAAKKLILPIILISALVPRFFAQAIGTFFARTGTSEKDYQDFLARIFSAFDEPGNAMQFKGFDSYGIGATHQAIPALRNLLRLPSGELTPPAEGEMGRIILEIGPFGFTLWYALRVALMFSNWRIFMQIKSPFLRQLALSFLLLQVINITNQFVFNNTLSIYTWFFSGCIFLFPELEYRQSLSYRYWASQQHV